MCVGIQLLVQLQIWQYKMIVFVIILTTVFPHTCYKNPNLYMITRTIILYSCSCNCSDQILEWLQEWSFYTVILVIVSWGIPPWVTHGGRPRYTSNTGGFWKCYTGFPHVKLQGKKFQSSSIESIFLFRSKIFRVFVHCQAYSRR